MPSLLNAVQAVFYVYPALFAGADAILIHSKKSEPDDIIEFMKEWADNVREYMNCSLSYGVGVF